MNDDDRTVHLATLGAAAIIATASPCADLASVIDASEPEAFAEHIAALRHEADVLALRVRRLTATMRLVRDMLADCREPDEVVEIITSAINF